MSSRRVFPTCAVAISLVIPPIVISALQVQVQPYPPISMFGRRQQGNNDPPSWIAAATTSNAGTASGIIMYSVRTDDFDEDSVLNDSSDDWLDNGGRISSVDVGGANRFQASSPAGTRPLTKLIAHSDNLARRKSYSGGTALKASQYGSGNGGRRDSRAAADGNGLGGGSGNGSRRKSLRNDSSLSTSSNPQLREIYSLQQRVMRHIRQQDLTKAYKLIQEMIVLTQAMKRDVGTCRNDASKIIDETIRSLAEMAFSRGGGGKEAADRIALGLDALHLQLSSQANLASPYNSIPRATWIKALRALTSARGVR